MKRLTLTNSMAAELIPKNIRVVAINPLIGQTGLTEKTEEFVGHPDMLENRAKVITGNPLGQFSQTKYIANEPLFLAQLSYSPITGVTIEVDGGRSI